ncbi:GNAT family N-acetyltransferase [Candidatus Haliotispira prima]|uniref:GNAT family N-acetyltransferase n=1 Tax=Candidatus Haliotispira prima TaxID=3034016 RepID=A0ABY8MKA2_9SPIO|nr:GNAT family N-acetyltransferase [Candidatus Haliotispira prima]
MPAWQGCRQNASWQPLNRYLKHCRSRKSRYDGFLAADSLLHNFLRSNEWQHLSLSTMFVSQYHDVAKQQRLFRTDLAVRKAFLYSSSERAGLEMGRGEIEAVLLWTNHGRLLFDSLTLRNPQPGLSRLPGPCRPMGEALPYLPTQELKRLLRQNVTRQFIGTRSHYDFLQHCYGFQLKVREYWMMVRKPQGLPPFDTKRGPIAFRSLPNSGGTGRGVRRERGRSTTGETGRRTSLPVGLRLERLTSEDFGRLLPLEQAYYAEEVLQGELGGPLRRALEKQCAKRLEQFLQYGIFDGDKLIARAMINAYGLYYWQIGGIYTTPEWRGQGLADFLLQRLSRAIEQAGRSAMLFVRLENEEALGLYYKNSFEILERMVIAQEPLTSH